ncbi:MAG: Tex-like N-terminal domain-containing protein [bacterium]|nr:helix-hairpin-helix domain-containing protein [bacterium]
MDILDTISRELNVKPEAITNILTLKKEGYTAPFMAKFRQEKACCLSESIIKKILLRHEELTALNKNQKELVKNLKEAGDLNKDVEKEILNTKFTIELDDLAAAYEPRTKGPAITLLRMNLKPLAEKILKQEPLGEPLEALANNLINETQNLQTTEQVLDGLRTILKEEIIRLPNIRAEIRQAMWATAYYKVASITKKENEKNRYNEYENFDKPVRDLPTHHFLTLQAASRQKLLTVNLEIDDDIVLAKLFKNRISTQEPSIQFLLEGVFSELYHSKFKQPAEMAIIKRLWKQAESTMFDSYRQTLQALLMQPALGYKPLCVLDSDMKAKKAVLISLCDKAQVMSTNELYFDNEENSKKTQDLLKETIEKNKPELIVLSARTHSRELWELCKQTVPQIKAIIIDATLSDQCSSSESNTAEITDEKNRKAVVLGRFLMNPLAEIVKIDPISMPVGAHHRTVNRDRLKKLVEDIVQTAVHKVGVNLNLASQSLLEYLSGLDKKMAQDIITHRKTKSFDLLNELFDVPGFTPKHFILASGFLHLTSSQNLLDRTHIHPEHYELVDKMTAAVGKSQQELFDQPDAFRELDLKTFEQGDVGLETLRQIISEFRNLGKDVRAPYELLEPDSKIKSLEDLSEGSIIKGRILSLTSFGAFVDIGVGINALLHKSAMVDQRDSAPTPTVKLGRVLTFQVTEVDKVKKRIQVAFPVREKPRYESKKTRPTQQGKGKPFENKDKRRGPPKHQLGTLGDQFANIFKSS